MVAQIHDESFLVDDLDADGKRALLSQILRHRSGDSSAVYPMSYGQQALYLLNLRAPTSAAYHMVFGLRIHTAGNLSVLRSACQALVNRHPVLHSRFGVRGGESIQEVVPEQEIDFEHQSAEGEPWDRVIRRGIEISQKAFNLNLGPVVRFKILSQAYDDHLLLLVVHHIVFDAWSLWLLLDELRILYAAELGGVPPQLPAPKFTYADYVLWQNKMLSGPAGERLWSYWENQLAGELPVLDLPYDRPRPPAESFKGAIHTFELDSALTQALYAVAQAHGVTLFMLLLTAFQVLLHRYSGQKELLIGSPAAGRTRSEFQGIVGYFVNPIVFRADFRDDPLFSDHLIRTRQTVLDGLAHQDYPFPLLVQRLKPRRDPSRSPIFQVMFVSQKAPALASRPGLLSLLEPIDIPQREGQFDLVLESVQSAPVITGEVRNTRSISHPDTAEMSERLRFNLKFNTDLFDRSTIVAMADVFRALLQAIVENPGTRVSRLRLNSGEAVYQRSASYQLENTPAATRLIHQRFEAWVAERPNSLAVVCNEQQIDYEQLNIRANQLAHYLCSLGVTCESIVGICISPSIDLIVAVLAVLKAGAGYLPLAIGDPDERLSAVILDAKPHLILTTSEFRIRKFNSSPRLVFVDSEWEQIATQPQSNNSVEVAPNNVAYVIYTSGTAGVARGVTVEHRQITNYVDGLSNTLHLQPGSTLAFFQPLAWDGCLTMLYGALCSGGTLHVISVERALDRGALGAYFAEHAIDYAKFTPSHFCALNPAAEPAAMPRRSLIFGGESLRSDLPGELQAQNPRCEIFNHYGPTETTVGAAMYRYDSSNDLARSRSMPLGRALPNVQTHVLDKSLQHCLPGIPGEIHIGGAGVARHYLNDPELTAARFIPDPFSSEAGARLFKSGDRGRLLPNGLVEFLGRCDSQLKIRGFRVDPREIEIALASHPAIHESLVVPHNQRNGDLQLIGYIVNNRSHTLTSRELRAFLATRLPSYMHPSTFVFLDALPLKDNGKVNHSALPAAHFARDLSSPTVTPRSRTEQLIAQVWQQVLGIRIVSVHDNFFDLGGHSLLLIQVHNRLLDKLGSEFSILELFEYPTIASLAERLRQKDSQIEPVKGGRGRAEKRNLSRRSVEQQFGVRKQHRESVTNGEPV